MAITSRFSRMIQLSTELVQESTRMRSSVRESLHSLNASIDRSRELLSTWPISGTPVLDWQLPVRQAPQKPDTLTTPLPGPLQAGSRSEALLEQIIERDFIQQALRLDGRHFIDCTICDCVLEYHGGPIILEGTHFTGCRFNFGGEAAMTISLLECFGLIEDQGSHPATTQALHSGARPN